MQVTLNPGESTIVVLAAPGWAGEPAAVEVTSTEADAVFLDGGTVTARAAQAGEYATTLADGTVLHSVIGPVPPADPPDLLDARGGGLAAGRDRDRDPQARGEPDPHRPAALVVDPRTAGIIRNRALQHDGDAARGLGPDPGATLSLGTVTDTYRVWVNGSPVPPAGILASSLDLGGLLQPGQNTIEVEVATTLINRLRVVTPGVYGSAARQPYGLIGPVIITPYGQAAAVP